ncbi:hypothetical protein BMS3Bbin07_01079 [bacterium BMS3Bbin07]|nr:hypothetical protein BMS3Bbin07_01079 [bacterium BMS3Bbin07]
MSFPLTEASDFLAKSAFLSLKSLSTSANLSGCLGAMMRVAPEKLLLIELKASRIISSSPSWVLPATITGLPRSLHQAGISAGGVISNLRFPVT